MGIQIWLFASCKLSWTTKEICEGMNSLRAFTLLSLVLNLENAQGHLSESSCKRFADILPHKLRELRLTFYEIRDYFVSMTILSSSSSFYCIQSLGRVEEKGFASFCIAIENI